MRFSKNLRIIKLVQLLGDRRPYLTASSLAEELEVTERTIYRDLNDLGILGFPIYHDEQGYKMYNTTPQPSWSLTALDVRTLQLFLNSSPLSQHDDYKSQIDLLIQKLKTMASAHLEPDSLPIQSAESSPFMNRKVKMRELEKALTEQYICEVHYQSLDDPSPRPRSLQPHALVIREGKWYMIAKDNPSDDPRLYRLERIKEFHLTQTKFERDATFSVSEYFKDSWSVFRGKRQTVTLKLHGKAIRIVQERHWITPQDWDQINDNEVICTLTVSGTEEIRAWTLSMAPDVEIIKPVELREEIIVTLTEILNKYKLT